jgi:PIN domain nuclease of toxin-antitoxin system
MAVLDASAVIALLEREPGAEVVGQCLPNADISAVNLAEVVTKLIDRGIDRQEIIDTLREMRMRVHAFDEQSAFASAMLRAATRAHGLSLGDRACIALGIALAQPVLTADQGWARLDVGFKVQVIR